MRLTTTKGHTERQNAYDAAQTDLLQALEALRQKILAHGAAAHEGGAGPAWGHVGFLDEVNEKLQELHNWYDEGM